MTTIAIVCGYRELDTLPEYAGRVVPLLREDVPAFAILSGGVTSRGAQSEAAVMGELLESLCPEQPIVLEEQAMSTLENLLNAKALGERTFGKVSRWIVYCDRAHRIKVAALTRLVLGSNAIVRSVPRPCAVWVKVLEPPTLVFESLAALVPFLRPVVRWTAMWTRGVSASDGGAAAAARR